jgi:Fe-S-cluster containining protein
MPELIKSVEVVYSKAEAEAQGLKNLKAMNLDAMEDDPRYAFMAALERDITARAKLNQLKKASDRLSRVVTPYSACRSGCSYCCNISAVISESEARAIAKASGRKMKTLQGVPSPAIREKWHRVPCPFLKKGRCSVYDDRPMVCRLMFNMADTPEQCNTDIPSCNSHVITLNLKELEHGFVAAFAQEPWGDIRDFFPPA